ncbi:ATP-binding protein [Aureimonas psammosilenae]|uniref:ATP-binding protein n=1 Tax=Aureimonas psammosilenae TaxID=2495496 RepID=UPI001F3C3CE4|nr:ATP-binding protein [Aureimonas psammosilenae]
MPKGLYARSLIIIIAPMVLMQSVVVYLFMERHWQLVTQRLSTAVVQDIAATIDLIEAFPQPENFALIQRIANDRLELSVKILPPTPLPAPRRSDIFNILDGILSDEIRDQIGRPFWIDTASESKVVEVRIQLPDRVLQVFARRNSAYASNTHIFIVWMVASSLVLLLIAILFLRNQIRPIQALAAAADSFGRGQAAPTDFRPSGASEVRRASLAFIQMRDRIERQIEQRTQMLNGVSHDLRTILTRFRLQLEFMEDSEDKRELQRDVEEMQRMLEGYLAFARDEQGEDVGELDLEHMLARLEADAERKGKSLTSEVEIDPLIAVRPDSFTRLVTNLVSNALRHGQHVAVLARREGRWLTITVEDDGPGIPADKREEVFKPFVRLDTARNIDAGGTGLGLSIARDVARSHGGDILLSDSAMGGLRALVRIPA